MVQEAVCVYRIRGDGDRTGGAVGELSESVSSAGRESFTLQSRSHLSHLSHRALPRYDSSSFACFVVQTVDGSHVSVMISQHVNSCTIVLSSTATIIITLLCILNLRLTTRLGLCQKTILECQPEADCLFAITLRFGEAVVYCASAPVATLSYRRSHASSRTSTAPTTSSASLGRSSIRMTTSSASPGPSNPPPAMPGAPPWTSNATTLREREASSASVLNRKRKLPEDADPGLIPKILKFDSETPEDLPVHEATNASADVDLSEGMTANANQATELTLAATNANTNENISEGATGDENQAANMSPELARKSKNQTDAKQRRDKTKMHVRELRKVLGIRSNVCERDTIARAVEYIKSLQMKYAETASELKQTKDLKLAQKDCAHIEMGDQFRLRDDTEGHVMAQLRHVLQIDSTVCEQDAIKAAVMVLSGIREQFLKIKMEHVRELAQVEETWNAKVQLETESRWKIQMAYDALSAEIQAMRPV
ncbi:hypothetical protein FA95DRAFT_1600214 [Auriscalpium vulgare]|uniref:Uncharacterized protein n=1 Tax=Auriscalpium vulgare TaxID=40419 RepID=A0ACB8R2L0_9AGAM|nr:hypothetical protein FA95DRAFT_1600214 [Auriscalpium vulgare]